MGRAPCCEKMGLKKGPWTHEEDKILVSHIEKHGHGNWRALPKLAGLLRCGKSCRLRWINYLRPDIKRGNFTQDEEETIIKLHEMLGNRWSSIAARLPGRTDNEIKNVWHTHLKKRLKNKSEPSNETTAPEYAPTSPQASSEVTSTSTSTSTSDHLTTTADTSYVEIKSEEMDPFQVMIIDDSFWSGIQDCFSMMDDNNVLGNSSFSTDFLDPIDLPGQSGLNSEDDVGFWYDLLIRTGGVPEFSVGSDHFEHPSK